MADDDQKRGENQVLPESVKCLAATYADAFWVSSWPGHIQLTLAESFANGGNHFHMAVVLPTEDAEILAKMILARIQRQKEEERKSD